MSQHTCSPRGADKGWQCCRRSLLLDVCDRCGGDGCAQCDREIDEILGDLLPLKSPILPRGFYDE